MAKAARMARGDAAWPGALQRAFRREEKVGLAYALWGRLLVLGFLLAYVLVSLPAERSLAYAGAILGFMALGVAPYLIRKYLGWGAWVTGVFLTLDVALLTYLLIVPPPIFAEGWTAQLNYRLPNFLFLGVFLVGMALSYSPVLVVWTGLGAMAAWSIGFWWVASLPTSITRSSKDTLDSDMTGQEIIEAFLHPDFVSLTVWYNQLIFLGLVTLILGIAVWRSRRLALRQVEAESARASLSRYFSPNIVDELTHNAEQLDRTRTQPAAILFADIVGFTAMTERMPADELVEMLREFHGRAADTVFEFGGTLDKYIGDCVMAHFGTPTPADDDALRALNCAIALVERTRAWNVEREAAGHEPVLIGVGVHYGDVIVGNVGSAQRLEYTVLGDTVNVASRLEHLTRELGAPVAISGPAIQAARGHAAGGPLPGGLTPRDRHALRGREAEIEVWAWTATGLPAPGETRRATGPEGLPAPQTSTAAGSA